MLSNIGPSAVLPKAHVGAVVASPSLEPDYRFHWVRDGALTMDTVLELYQRARNSSDSARYLQLLLAYAEFSRRNQLTSNPSGEADGMGLGEPKFNVDGTAFTGSWGRPQNNGPALRASTLIRLAHLLLDQGRADLVKQTFYDSGLPARTVIKSDLEFVSHHWRDTNFDLWEEVKGRHFYTEMVQRRALLEGADLAERLGDAGAASWYRSQGKALESAILRHWDACKGMVRATLDRDDGLATKSSGLDVAVVLGAIHGVARKPARADRFFVVNDDRVLQTAQKIEEAFRRIYGVNSRERDSDNPPLGAAIGRYPEDTYSGGTAPLGNPWFLATAAFGEFYYRAAEAIQREGCIVITNANLKFFGKLPGLTRLGAVRAGDKLQPGRDARFEVLVQGLRETGDAYLRRVKFHGDPRGALSEQFNRDSGYMQSAAELTWSHASLLTAAWAREQAFRR